MGPNYFYLTHITSQLKITVIITAYNRRNYLIEAMKSVSLQTLKKEHYEVIVVKNFYDDKVEEFINEQGFISVYSNEKLQGKMLYDGIKIASGNLISLLDDDDIFLPQKLEHVYYKFQSNPSLSYLHNGYTSEFGDRVDYRQNHRISENMQFSIKQISLKNSSLMQKRKIAKFKQAGGDFNASCISFKKDILKDKVSFLERVNHSIDTFLFCSALISGGELMMDTQVDTLYRISNTNTTNFTIANLIIQKQEREISNDLTKTFDDNRIRMTTYLKDLINDLIFIKLSLLDNNTSCKKLLDYQIHSVSLEFQFARKTKVVSNINKNVLKHITLYLYAGFLPSFVSATVIKQFAADILHFLKIIKRRIE